MSAEDDSPSDKQAVLASERQVRAVAVGLVHMIRSLIQTMTPPDHQVQPEVALAFVSKVLSDPAQAEQEIVAKLLGKITFSEVKETLAALPSTDASPRQIIGLISKDLPKKTPGRRAPSRENKAAAVQRAIWLLPTVQTILELRRGKTKRTVRETIQYLAADYPEQANYILEHAELFESILSDRRLMSQATTIPARSRIVAAVIAGNELGHSRFYALRNIRQGLGKSLRAQQINSTSPSKKKPSLRQK